MSDFNLTQGQSIASNLAYINGDRPGLYSRHSVNCVSDGDLVNFACTCILGFMVPCQNDERHYDKGIIDLH